MRHTLAKPCAHCPFRTDAPGYLRRARVFEIVEDISRGGAFPCHKTTEEADDGDLEAVRTSQECAGAAAFLDQQGQSSQLRRVAERLGLPVVEVDEDAPVFRTALAMADHHAPPGDDAPEYVACSAAGEDCSAPAGFMVGGMAIESDPLEYESAAFECCVCGEPVCGECVIGHDGEDFCADCLETTR